MRWKEELAETRRRFDLLSFYGKFEQIVIFILTVLIAVFIVFAVWNLACLRVDEAFCLRQCYPLPLQAM